MSDDSFELYDLKVEVVAPVPVIGLIGPSGTMAVTGHALEESP